MDWQREVASMADELRRTADERAYKRQEAFRQMPYVPPLECRHELGPEECRDEPNESHEEWRELNAWLSRNS